MTVANSERFSLYKAEEQKNAFGTYCKMKQNLDLLVALSCLHISKQEICGCNIRSPFANFVWVTFFFFLVVIYFSRAT